MQDIIISEKKLEDYICSYLKCQKPESQLNDHLCCSVNSTVYRQFNLGSYGVIDILVVEKYSNYNAIDLTVYELKKGVIDVSAFMQVLKYKTGLIDIFKDDYEIPINEIKCILIGSDISSSGSFSLIPRSVGVELYTYDIDMESGLYIKDCNGFVYTERDEPKSINKKAVCFDYIANDKEEFF